MTESWVFKELALWKQKSNLAKNVKLHIRLIWTCKSKLLHDKEKIIANTQYKHYLVLIEISV